jgi:hypothetical protein
MPSLTRERTLTHKHCFYPRFGKPTSDPRPPRKLAPAFEYLVESQIDHCLGSNRLFQLTADWIVSRRHLSFPLCEVKALSTVNGVRLDSRRMRRHWSSLLRNIGKGCDLRWAAIADR